MSNLRQGQSVCPVCQFDNANIDQQDSRSLKPYDVLDNGKYLLGRIVSANGEGFTYLGLDKSRNKKVWIREFFPDTIAYRAKNGLNVFVNESDNFQFKTLKIDFSDLYQDLMNLKNKAAIVSTIDLFEQNDTVYSILEYTESITLEDFLNQIGGSLNYKEAGAIFEPFFKGILNLHMNNIIHRGISTETILLDKSGNLILTDFAISAERTANSEITSELFDGYSAPEQYSMSEWQGTWTDVYSAASVFYRTITGITPQAAPDRKKNDKLISLTKVDNNIPKNISYTIHKAMIVDSEHRTESMDELIGSMFYSDATGGTQVGSTKRVDINTPVPASNQPHRRKIKKSPLPYTIASALITTVVLLTVMFLFIAAFEKDEGSNVLDYTSSDASIETDLSETDISEEAYSLPNFVNSYIKAVELDKGYNTYFTVSIKLEFSEHQPKDMVLNQNVNPGTKITKETAPIMIELTVSKGPQELPDMRGYTRAKAEAVMKEKDLLYQIQYAYDADIENDHVVRIERGGNTIIIYISKKEESSSSVVEEPSSSVSTNGEIVYDEYGREIEEDGTIHGPIVRNEN